MRSKRNPSKVVALGMYLSDKDKDTPANEMWAPWGRTSPDDRRYGCRTLRFTDTILGKLMSVVEGRDRISCNLERLIKE